MFSLSDNALESLRSIGFFHALDTLEAPTGCVPMRVIEQHRSSFVLSDGHEHTQANAHPKLKHKTAVLRPGVGDFVWLDTKLKLFSSVLPRKNALVRAAAGERHAEQLLAANIDRAIIVCGLDRDYSERRIERYLALVQGSGLAAAVILSKADLASDAKEVHASLVQRLKASDCPVLLLDNRNPDARAEIEPLLPAGHTGVLLGSSGAGKSTLTNSLALQHAMATGTVRERDGRGRHTTVHRALIKLEWGACLIDSPGLREIKLTGEEAIESTSFNDIAELELRCKFRDCEHESEPGCAVQAAVDSGELAFDRLMSFKKLLHERDAAAARASAKPQQKSSTRHWRR